MKTISKLSAAAAVLSGTADAFWRMECHARSGLARIDPIVTPGKISSHAHAIHGGSSRSTHFHVPNPWNDSGNLRRTLESCA